MGSDKNFKIRGGCYREVATIQWFGIARFHCTCFGDVLAAGIQAQCKLTHEYHNNKLPDAACILGGTSLQKISLWQATY